MRSVQEVVILIAAVVLLSACGSRAEGAAGPSPTPTVAAPKSDLKLDGKILLSRGGTILAWSGGSAKQVGKDTQVQQADWSPDGKKIAYVKLERDYSDIWVMDSSGGNQTNLTKIGKAGADTWFLNPHWSPDGSSIAYLSDQTTYDLALWQMKADGSGRKQISFMNDYLGGLDGPAWYPKGDRIAFTAFRTGKAQIWAITLANSKWEQITDMDDGSYDARWSPAGDLLAFVGRDGTKSNLWLTAPPDGTPLQVSTDGMSRSPVWSPDGKVLAFLSGQGGKFDLWAVNVDKGPDGLPKLGAPKRVTTGLAADPSGGLSWAK